MTNIDREPLGFSDLNDDEVFVVLIFRHWQALSDDVSSDDIDLVPLSGHNRLCSNINSLVAVFETSHGRSKRSNRNRSSVLTLVEEDLLDAIGCEKGMPTPSIALFRRILDETGTIIRPASTIPRSGHDYIVEIINLKTTQAFEALYPALRGIGNRQRLSTPGSALEP